MNSTKKAILIYSLLLFAFTCMNAQKTVNLWDGNPPTKNELNESEKLDKNAGWLTNVPNPDISIFLPEKAVNTGMAVIICPGGGYGGLAIDHEGHQFAKWLNTKGVAGIVLKYRMPNKHKEIPLDDTQQAIRYVREHAEELGINKNKIGIAGFSAGGHLAATASTHFITSGTSTRPDFSILFYPVITMDIATHGGSRYNLLGETPSLADMHIFSNEKQVNSNTPPALFLLSDDDDAVSPINSIMYYEALKKNNIPASIYIFPEGGHGWGMRENFKYHTQMLTLLEMWLKDIQKI